MSNEIKEIIYLEKYIDKYKSEEKSIINGNRLTTPAMLDYLEVKALLDYITNLQNKIDSLEDTISDNCECIYAYSEIINNRDKEITNLQQENERLRQQNFNLIEYRDSIIDENREQRENLFDYKSRCEKAIELLKQDKQSASFNSAEVLAINILQGGKDE